MPGIGRAAPRRCRFRLIVAERERYANHLSPIQDIVQAMAKCGIFLRYPVRLAILHDDGTIDEGGLIGEAQTLNEAIGLAERLGWTPRADGSLSCFVAEPVPGSFVVTVYPD